MEFIEPGSFLTSIMAITTGIILLFFVMAIFVAKAKFLSLTEKLLMIIMMYLVPVLGVLLTLFFYFKKRSEFNSQVA